MATQTFYTKGDKRLQAGSNTSAIVQEFENERDALETAFQAVRDELDTGALSDAALLPGQAGGQTLNGGTAASEDLVLQSTANATKGNVDVGTDDSTVILGGSGSTVGVFGGAGATKVAPIAALTDSSGGTPSGTIAAITNAANVGSADVGPTADAIASLATHIEAIRSALSSYGWF